MKKIIAVMLTLALLLPAAAWACENAAVLVAKSETTVTYTGVSYWALTDGCVLAGIKDYGEMVPRMNVQNTHSQYVAGWMENGWMREAGMVRTLTVDGQVMGLAKLCNVTITIYTEYVPMCEAVVHALLGEDAEITANSLAACALWWDGDYAANIFFPSYADRVEIGYATFNYQDVTPFCIGHFGEELRFGLMCGYWEPMPETYVYTDTNITAEAQANAEAVANAQASANAGAYAGAYSGAAAVSVSNSGSIDNSGDGCYRNNTIVQINLFSVIWQGIKNITKQGCEE